MAEWGKPFVYQVVGCLYLIFKKPENSWLQEDAACTVFLQAFGYIQQQLRTYPDLSWVFFYAFDKLHQVSIFTRQNHSCKFRVQG